MEAQEQFIWQDHAPCKGATDLFFPAETLGSMALAATEQRAKAICATCLHIDQCLQLALISCENHGVWGGKTAKERRSIIRRNQRAAARERSSGLSAHG
jgi:WhiB family redox-sensing transcriptional regulator